MTADNEGGDRKSVASPPEIVTDKLELAKREAANGLRQFDVVIEQVQEAISSGQFRLRPSTLLSLNRIALEGINRYAGNYRPSAIEITGSKHKPPPVSAVPGLVEELCDYVNDHFADRSAVHLSAYVMWRLNWIHPFDDGNGRTSRAISYLVLCAKLNSRLPGKPTIPELIASNKRPYYDALEAADGAWETNGGIDLEVLEKLLSDLLGTQLITVLEEARGSPLS